MLQESYHPGLAIPRWSVSVWTLHAQNDQFLYYSIVHTYYKGSTDKTAVVYLLNHARILPVLGMNQDEPCTDKYIKCTAMFMHCIYHVQTLIYIPEFICSVYPRFRHDYTKTNIHVHACVCTYSFKECMYHVYVCYVQFHRSMNMKIKKLRFG